MVKRLHAGILMFVVLIVQTPNHPPVIKIIQPVNHSICTWGSHVQYSVDVSDKEDGEAKFQEIQSAEVLVRLKYVENSVQASAYLKQKNLVTRQVL